MGIISVFSNELNGPRVRIKKIDKAYKPSHMAMCIEGSINFFAFIECRIN